MGGDSMITAVIQAGGKGTRLSSVTGDLLPKPMVDVLGKPLLQWQIESLHREGISRFIIIVGHLGDVIKNYFDDGKWLNVSIDYILEQNLCGTAGSIYKVRSFVSDNDFLFVYADAMFDVDVRRMMDFHEKHHSAATLFLHPNNHPFDSDLVVLDENDKILGFDGKQNSRNYWYENLVNAGIFIFTPRVFEYLREHEAADVERDLLTRMLENGESLYGYKSSEYVRDAGTVDRLKLVTEDLSKEIVEKRNLRNAQKAVFLDRDGTINQLRGLLYKEEDFELEPNAVEAIKRLNKSEYLVFVVTNQPVVARGLCSVQDVKEIHKKLSSLLGNGGAYYDDLVFCPHHPDKGYKDENPLYKIKCRCRKPEIGMIVQLAEKYNVNLSQSWMVGDSTVDIKTAENAGLKSILVRTGESGNDNKFSVTPQYIADDILDAVNKILGDK